MAKFEFLNRKVTLDLPGSKAYNIEVTMAFCDKLQENFVTLAALPKQMADGEKSRDDAVEICQGIIDDLLCEGAFEDILSDRANLLDDSIDVIWYIRNEVAKFNAKNARRRQDHNPKW